MAATLVQHDYLRQRLHPQPGDQFYLHLKDLRQALEPHRDESPLHVLDYGCGGSPYRSLFPNAARYVCADLQGTPGIDQAFDSEGLLPDLASSSFDLVLSTQVLEHVADPSAYLAEALRLLRPGGKLLLSTHGTFPDHGCPHDYWRWTADGLNLTLKCAGFTVESVSRLTCGLRAVAFILGQALQAPSAQMNSFLGLFWRLCSRLERSIRSSMNKALDHLTSDSSQQSTQSSSTVDYCIALLAHATK